MVENGVQLTLTSTLKSTAKTRISADGLNNGSHTTKEKHEHNGTLQPSKGQKQLLCTTCANGHTCQSVLNRTRQMRALIDSKKPYQAHSVFKHLMDEGHKPSLVTYTILLTALTNQRMFESIPSLLAQVELAGIRPDSIFFNALINAFVEAKRMGEAISTFWKMKHSGCHPTTSTFNTLIKGYGIVGKPKESQHVFDMMGIEASVRPNLTTYNILVKAWCDQRHLEEAWGVVGKMRAGGIEPDIVTYNTIASAYANNGETWRAEDLIVEIQTRVRTSERTWGIIIGGYCQEGRLEEALRCIQQMKDAGIVPNVVIFNTLLKGFLDANDMAAVNNILGLMEQFGIKPDIVTYSHQLNTFSSLGHMAKCMKVFDKMIEAGIEPDPQVYSILAKGFVRAKQPEKAEDLLLQMSHLGVCPNVVTFTTVISGWCSLADMDSAMRVYEKMCQSGVYPNLRTFETLIWGYSEQKQPWKAEEVLQMMRETGVKPKQSTYCLIADAWKAVGLIENMNNSNGSPNGPFVIDKLDHSDDYCNVQISEDNNKLQSFDESNGRALNGRSRSSFLQITNALGSSGIVSAKILKAGEFPSKRLKTIKNTSFLQRSQRFQLLHLEFCRKQLQKNGGFYVFESIKTVDLDFSSCPCESISVLGRDLIGRMLNRDVSSRMCADEVLGHPWVMFYTECPLKVVAANLCLTNKIIAPKIPWDRHKSEVDSLSDSKQRSEDQDECGLVDALTAAITRVRISETKRSRLCSPAITIQ